MELRIGSVKFKNPFFVAPLAGVSDGPFREICFEMGAAYAVSEMVSAKGLWFKDKNTESLLKISDNEGLVGYQIFGHEPEIMADAARKLNERKNVILDINMGCPVPKVVKNFEGSYLMNDVKLSAEIVESVVKASEKPVTCKIRAGWDENHKNAVEMARALRDAGASSICVHARTREQFYSGKADLDIIRSVREEVSDIPIVGNGDVTDVETALRMMDYTGCDFVMIGRGALGNPWIYRELSLAYEALEAENAKKGELLKTYEKLLENGKLSLIKPSTEEKCDVMIDHLNRLASLKGEKTACKEMRKHVGWYLKGVRGSARLRGEINQITEIDALKEAILKVKEEYR